MPYQLGMDVGTTWTAAAVFHDGKAEIVALDHRATAIPTVVALPGDGDPVVGRAAERKSGTAPASLARHVKRRIGDTAPVVVDGRAHSPQSILAHVLSWVVARVSETQGEPPQAVTVTHPANWGPYKIDLLRDAIRLAGLDDATTTTMTEPEAAAHWYASAERMAGGETVAVYDLGGGTFDAVILRRTANGFEVVGQPHGVEHLGGIDFDEALFQHVLDTAGVDVAALDPEDEATLAALARLRDDVVEAKEALSDDTSTSLAVLPPLGSTSVRVTREEFEGMISPGIDQTASVLQRCLADAGVRPDDLRSVLLVGGSSRIPLVARRVAAVFGRPVAVDAHPKHAVALGAALVAGEGVVPAEAPLPPPPIAADGPGPEAATKPAGRPPWLLGVAAAAIAAAVIAFVVLSSGGGSGGDTTIAGTTGATSAPTTGTATTTPITTSPGTSADIVTALGDRFLLSQADAECTAAALETNGFDTDDIAASITADQLRGTQENGIDDAFVDCGLDVRISDFDDPAARGEIEIPGGFVSCDNRIFGFAISHPPDWAHSVGTLSNTCRAFIPDPDNDEFETDDPLESGTTIFLPMYILVGNQPIEDAIADRLAVPELSEGDRIEIIDQSDVTINGVDGVRLEWTLVLSDGTRLVANNLHYFLRSEGTTFEIFMSCCLFNDETAFEQIVATFRLLDN